MTITKRVNARTKFCHYKYANTTLQMRSILLLALLGYAHSQTCQDGTEPYTLELIDDFGDGWDSLKITAISSSGSVLQHKEYGGEIVDNEEYEFGRSIDICNLNAIGISAPFGPYDDTENTIKLTQNGVVLFHGVRSSWGRVPAVGNYPSPPPVGTFLWASCEDALGWTGTQCEPCRGKLTVDGICSDGCDSPDEGYIIYDNNVYGTAESMTGHRYLGCGACGDDQILENSVCKKCPSGELPNSANTICEACDEGEGRVSADDLTCAPCGAAETSVNGVCECPVGTVRSGGVCVPCEAHQIAENRQCTDCPFGKVPDNNECVCNEESVFITMQDSHSTDWETLRITVYAGGQQEDLGYSVSEAGGSTNQYVSVCNLEGITMSELPSALDLQQSFLKVGPAENKEDYYFIGGAFYKGRSTTTWGDLTENQLLWSNCTGGQSWTGSGCGECQGGQKQGPNGECQCPGGQVFIDNECKCPEGQEQDSNGVCQCPGGQEQDSNGVCQCPGGQEQDSNGVCQCPGGKVFEGGECQCPVGQGWTGTECVACQGGQAQGPNGECQCPEEQEFIDSECKCPVGYGWSVDACVACIEGQVQGSNGECEWNCPSICPVSAMTKTALQVAYKQLACSD